jgi:hypothetical protein
VVLKITLLHSTSDGLWYPNNQEYIFFLTVIQTRLANLLTKTRRLGGGDQ